MHRAIGTLNQGIFYSYDNDFRITDITYACSSTGYAYDNDSLLITAGDFTISRNTQTGFPESVTDNTLTLSCTFNGFAELETLEYTVEN